MNIYEILDFIRKGDTKGDHIRIADYLNGQYCMGRISAENLFLMYVDLLVLMLMDVAYNPGRET